MRADRLITMMLKLQINGKTTTQQLADELEVSRRTILRDIDALSQAGVPIYTDSGHGGGVALDENYRVKLTGLREQEIRALFLSSNTHVLRDIGLGQAAENTVMKLMASLPSLHQQAVEHVRQRIYIDPVWWWHGSQSLIFLDDLYQAIYADRWLYIVYQRRDGTLARYEVEPYSLVAKSSMWYLVATHDCEFRTYRVSRLHHVELLDQTFDRREDFDLVAYWQTSSSQFSDILIQYKFTLRIKAERMNFVKWHTPGRFDIVHDADEDGYLSLHFEVESIDTAKMVTLALGTDAIIVDPPELVEGVKQQIKEMYEAL